MKPCPFCGSAKVSVMDEDGCDLTDEQDSGGQLCWVACQQCFAEGPVVNRYEEAVEKWNHRDKESAEKELYNG